MSWLQEHVYLMSAGLDLRQGQGLVILSKSPEHRMMGGQANCLFVTRVPAHGSESAPGGQEVPGAVYSPATHLELSYN